MNPDWLIPQWPAPAGVHAVCTTRAGGHSLAPYNSMNLGDHVGDAPSLVAANRASLQAAIQAKPIFLSQVHGTEIIRISETTAQGAQADACLTGQPKVACTIMVADCLPVLFCNKQGSLVAAAHAGWRSLAGRAGKGVIEQVLESFGALNHVNHPADINVWLGPCIGGKVFEVGPDVRDAFMAYDALTESMFTPRGHGKWLADLQGLARIRLAALGIHSIYGNDGSQDWCTVSQASRFFSYRRDHVSGRMAACIWID